VEGASAGSRSAKPPRLADARMAEETLLCPPPQLHLGEQRSSLAQNQEVAQRKYKVAYMCSPELQLRLKGSVSGALRLARDPFLFIHPPPRSPPLQPQAKAPP
jgi:hypothetical protein